MPTYGFIGLKDIADQKLNEVATETIMTAVQESAREHTREINGILASVAAATQKYKIRYQLPANEVAQPLDNKGVPKPTQPTGVYNIAFPLMGSGTAYGTDRVSRAYMTVNELDRLVMEKLIADANWMRRQLLAAWFSNQTWTYTDDKYGDLVVQPLANSDTVTYVRRNGTASTDTHFLAQAAAIDDANNPFKTIYQELDEHPSNRGPYIACVPTNLVSSIEAMNALIEPSDSALIYGSDVTRLVVNRNSDDTERGTQLAGFGDRLVGRVSGVYVVEWSSLPDDYITWYAAGASDPAFGMREHEAAELRGLFPELNDVNGNLMESRFIRYAGFGAMNRVAAGVTRIGNAAYAEPSGYTAPIAS